MDNFNGSRTYREDTSRSIPEYTALTSKTKGVHVVSCDTIIIINKLKHRADRVKCTIMHYINSSNVFKL